MKAIESEEDGGGGGGGGGGRAGKRRGSEGMSREKKIEAMKVGCDGSQDIIFNPRRTCAARVTVLDL